MVLMEYLNIWYKYFYMCFLLFLDPAWGSYPVRPFFNRVGQSLNLKLPYITQNKYENTQKYLLWYNRPGLKYLMS